MYCVVYIKNRKNYTLIHLFLSKWARQPNPAAQHFVPHPLTPPTAHSPPIGLVQAPDLADWPGLPLLTRAAAGSEYNSGKLGMAVLRRPRSGAESQRRSTTDVACGAARLRGRAAASAAQLARPCGGRRPMGCGSARTSEVIKRRLEPRRVAR